MTQSECQYSLPGAEQGSTYSAKTVQNAQKGYGRHKAEMDRIEEEAVTKKWEAENRRLKQLSKESNRRLQNIKKKEAEQRLKILKEQNDILEKRKKQRDQHHVRNIRNNIKPIPKPVPVPAAPKTKARPVSKPNPAVPREDRFRQKEPRAVSAVGGTAKPQPRQEETVEKRLAQEEEKYSQANEVRLEDFLSGGNLNGLDLDVRGSMQLTMRKLAGGGEKKEEALIQRGDLLDSLDLQIASILPEGKATPKPHIEAPHEAIKADPHIEANKPSPTKFTSVKKPTENEAEEIEEEIGAGNEDSKKGEWLRKSIKVNVESWRKVNNQLRREMPLHKLAAVPEPVLPPAANSIMILGKEEVKRDFQTGEHKGAAENGKENRAINLKAERRVEPPLAAEEQAAVTFGKNKSAAVAQRIQAAIPAPLPPMKRPVEGTPGFGKGRPTKPTEDNMSEMAARPAKKRGGPKSKATTTNFTKEDDINVEEFIMVPLLASPALERSSQH